MTTTGKEISIKSWKGFACKKSMQCQLVKWLGAFQTPVVNLVFGLYSGDWQWTHSTEMPLFPASTVSSTQLTLQLTTVAGMSEQNDPYWNRLAPQDWGGILLPDILLGLWMELLLSKKLSLKQDTATRVPLNPYKTSI